MVIPEMVEREDGNIIIVSSIGGMRASQVIELQRLQSRRHYACKKLCI